MDDYICPYCSNIIISYVENQKCPHCGNMAKSEELINTEIKVYIRLLKKDKVYDRVKTLIWNEEVDLALREIRSVVGQKKSTVGIEDPVVEPLLVQEILKTKPDHWSHSHVTIVEKKVEEAMKITTVCCPACNHQISTKAESCPNCGNPTGVHVCPKCGSINTKTISGASKATSVFLWGPFAANKVVSKYQCKDCWHKF